MKIKIKYFAAMRESTGKSSEVIETTATSLSAVYDELNDRYHFPLNRDDLKVAVNEKYVDFEEAVSPDDTVVFIPPVAGG